ncbi:MAG: nucleotide exchange factor GrpE [Desulfobulbaceae bacterium]|uniref:Protein GrpE n=1 Tax=Candidatus Desulfobia pelagia TaxID=2841692 RepID=A0A8J6NEP1_9BACT|nr:nucleotide exchange factor GrpE [Candidatus Desulfobia pelagia]
MAKKEGVVEEPRDAAADLKNEEDFKAAGDTSDEAAAEEVLVETEEISELEKARQEAEEAKDRLLRLAAEFENFKKRLERERSLALKYAEESIIKELLPAVDNLERAIDQGKENHSVEDLLAGVELTYRGIVTTLAKFEVAPMICVGAPFDPNHHEALAMEESDEMDPNSVLKEFQKGYTYKDRLIRPAKVVVAKKAEETKE